MFFILLYHRFAGIYRKNLIGSHGMRHTSATLLLANGCDIKTVSARLGHSDIETTNIYLQALENVDRLAAGTFDRVFKTEK